MELLTRSYNKDHVEDGKTIESFLSETDFTYIEKTIDRWMECEQAVFMKSGAKKHYKISFEKASERVSCELIIWLSSRTLYSKESSTSLIRAFDRCIECLEPIDDMTKAELMLF